MNSNLVNTALAFVCGFMLSMVMLYDHTAGPQLLLHKGTLKAPKHDNVTCVNDDSVNMVRTGILELRKTLHNRVRILCWSMTTADRVDRQKAITATWGKRCHRLLYVMAGAHQSTTNVTADGRIQNVVLPLKETYSALWAKTKATFSYIYDAYNMEPRPYDWVFKVDDDSFVIMENLQMFLEKIPQSTPHFYGARYKTRGGYNSGGPGYAISWTNTGKLVAKLQSNNCTEHDSAEDINIAMCLKSLGITPGETVNEKGGYKFSIFDPVMTLNKHMIKKETKYNWYWGFTAYPLNDGFECCSDDMISFHYVDANMMKAMEFMIYYVTPFTARDMWNAELL